MSILEPRHTFLPLSYPKFYDYYTKQQSAHWIPSEVSLTNDIFDWRNKLSDNEKNVVGSILKGFVLTEIHIENYWNKVASWFPIPEIVMMTSCFSNMESIHAVAYSMLQENLGLEEQEAFLQEPTIKAKIDRIINTDSKSPTEIYKSLAVFSAMNEAINLFSSFAVLMSFSQRNLLKGISKIIEWSIRDESTHAAAGVDLANQLRAEFPEIWTDELKKEIYDAMRLTIALEDDFIDQAFVGGPLPNLDPKDLKNYLRFRANTLLSDLGLKSNWKNIDKKSLEKLSWFSVLSSGVNQEDFFANRETNYSKGAVSFDSIWD